VDVVVAVSVAVCAVVLLIVTEVGERLHVTGLEALDGDVVTAQVRATVPVNELDGVTVMVEVLPEVAPALLTLMTPLLERVKSEVELIGSQNPLQPARSRGAASASLIHLFDCMRLLRVTATCGGFYFRIAAQADRPVSFYRAHQSGAL
jgi:hypothetical protein